MTKTTTGKLSYHSGQAAELQVARHYEREGWRVLQHRFKGAAGEIDLVLRRDDTVLFVEVKRARTHDIAASRISLQQIARINQSAEIFVAEKYLVRILKCGWMRPWWIKKAKFRSFRTRWLVFNRWVIVKSLWTGHL